jgi:HAD superfamily, subfamily IIIB (Acid phosphatase)
MEINGITLQKTFNCFLHKLNISERATAMGKPCFIFDLDDTLADNTHRMHLMRAGQWDDYFAACPHDPPIVAVVECAIALHVRGFPIVVISGRSESVREETEAWLMKYVCVTERVYLRAQGDFRKNSEVKLEALADLRAVGFAPRESAWASGAFGRLSSSSQTNWPMW